MASQKLSCWTGFYDYVFEFKSIECLSIIPVYYSSILKHLRQKGNIALKNLKPGGEIPCVLYHKYNPNNQNHDNRLNNSWTKARNYFQNFLIQLCFESILDKPSCVKIEKNKDKFNVENIFKLIGNERKKMELDLNLLEAKPHSSIY